MSEQKTSGAQDSVRGACERIGVELDRLLGAIAPSPEVRQHFHSARIEVLKGLRGLIDERIQHLSTEPKKGTTVPVE